MCDSPVAATQHARIRELRGWPEITAEHQVKIDDLMNRMTTCDQALKLIGWIGGRIAEKRNV